MMSETPFQKPEDMVRNLDGESLDLIVKRDVDCNGSWDNVRRRVKASLLPKINFLEVYERQNKLNLGTYVRTYLADKKA